MKHYVFTLLVLLAGIGTASANIINGTCGDNLNWSYDTNNHSLVISGTGDMYDYGYSNCPWNTIAGSITSVTLPSGLTRIGNYAFKDCNNLTGISIPEGVISIGDYSFENCYAITSVVLPNSVVELGSGAFENCGDLSKVELSNSLTQLPWGAFYLCEIYQITIPASITAIGENALDRCENVYLESSVPATIYSNTFKSDVLIHVPCSSVSTYLSAPIWQFLNIIGNMDYEFSLNADEGGTARITNSVCAANTVVIEATAETGYRFTGWSDGNTDNPRAIVLTADKSVTAQFERSYTEYQVNLSGFSYMECEQGTFYGPTWSGQILEGSHIYFRAISDCGTFAGWSDGSEESYRNIQITSDTTISASYTGIETYQVSITAGEHGSLTYSKVGAVTTCEGLIQTRAIPDEGYHFYKWSDGNKNAWREIEITEDVTLVAYFAKGERGGWFGEDLSWSYESDIRPITVRGTGEMTEHGYGYIGYFEQDECVDATKVLIEEGATNISQSIFKSLRHLQTAEIAGSITRIEESAFEDCRSLEKVTFATPSALNNIGDWAFYNCHTLQNIVIPENVTEIGNGAFYGCTYLTELILPASVQAIGDNAFALCSRLNKITSNAVVPPAIADKTFFEVNKLTPVYVPKNSVSSYKADLYWGRMNIVGSETAVDNSVLKAAFPHKLFINGEVLILRGGKMYNLQGVEVK